LGVLSVLVSLYSVCRLFKVVKLMRTANSNLTYNERMIYVQIWLLVGFVLSFIGAYVVYLTVVSSAFFIKLYVASKCFELGQQLAICYICWSLGSSVQLRRFRLLLVKDNEGSRVTVKYELYSETHQHSSYISETSEDFA
jgi:hypothetical protein